MAAPDPLRQPDEANGAASERDRLIAAFARAVSETGYANLKIEQVRLYARASEGAFERYFASKEQGLIAAQEAFLGNLWEEVTGACRADAEWPLRVRAGLEVVLNSMVEASGLARVFAVEAAVASVAAVERQVAAQDRFAELLREGRRHYPKASELPEVTERVVVGGVASILNRHLLMEEPQAIPPCQPQLLELLLMPYVGVDESRRIAGA